MRGSEIPSDTTPFAKALGFGQRSSLENNGAGSAHYLPGARTESLNAAWDYCLDWIASAPAIVLWHHWPDDRIHQLAEPGDGFQKLCREAAQQLTSDSFWKMIERMATGRRLVITSDHGYAASGMFADVSDKEQAAWLKTNFGSSRFAHGSGHRAPLGSAHFALLADTHTARTSSRSVVGNGAARAAIQRSRTADLSLLEVAVPFIEFQNRKNSHGTTTQR